ncbi:MAG: tRNA pseudouridine55 synthase [Flavobacteriales bacterium]|jgi:tRNA pseudouridine55 synthase
MFPTPNKFASGEDFQSGTILLVDKPLGWTSFDVVNKLRHVIRNHFSIKKIKVGHAGTLDPLASGLLIVCTGKMTKKIDLIMNDDKVYTGEITFGKTTPSYDSETEADAEFSVDHLTPKILRDAVKSMEGALEQTPPAYSAKKIDGTRAYKLARQNKPVEMRKNWVTINQFVLEEVDIPKATFTAGCSKGTYIRSLAHELGANVNSGAFLSALRRESSGEFFVQEAMSIEDLEKTIRNIDIAD